jgi:energy-coupling factor transporter ATP-binding protein EcfA2
VTTDDSGQVAPALAALDVESPAPGGSADRAKCAGRTRAGKACRARPQPDSEYCRTHDASDANSDQDSDEDKAEKKSVATILVEIAQERYEFGVSTDSETYGVPRSGPRVVLMLRGGKTSLRGQLARTYFTRTGKAAPQQALADALLVIEGIAQETEPERLYLRVAQHEGALWLDLGDQTGRAVKITAGGWTVELAAPVLFKRTALTGALPEPVPGDSMDDLWPWLNVATEDRPMLIAALVAALMPDIPHPVVGLTGEQGTGKTTATKVLAGLLDPGPVLARKAPKDPEAWITAASGSWVVGLENLSDIPPWLSDSICRAVTGDGDVRRKLYTDGDLAVFAFRRVIIANGIDFGAIRGDLADRMLSIELAPISDDKRREEETFWPDWHAAHPCVLGALLDLAARVRATLPSVTLPRKPRMADYARVLKAVDTVLDTKGLSRYVDKQSSLATDSLTADQFIAAVADAIAGMLTGTFEGTAADLLDRATPSREGWRAPKGWPSTPRAVTTTLRRQAPVMRKAGWTITDDGGANHGNRAVWTITPPPPSPRAGTGEGGIRGSG